MLRLPQFGVELPTDVAGVVALLRDHPGARVIAGGTDILPNLKHRLDEPPKLISLAQVAELRTISKIEHEGVSSIELGAGATLTAISEHPLVREHLPSLAQAAGIVASPLIRNMGTIGGNLNLDTRCRYVNQTRFYRDALGGGCLKSEGNVCHVVPGGRNCVAAMSSDCVPVLISLDAEVVLAGPAGERVVAASKYFKADGLRHTVREDAELTTRIRVPVPKGPRRSTYAKWTGAQEHRFPVGLGRAALRSGGRRWECGGDQFMCGRRRARGQAAGDHEPRGCDWQEAFGSCARTHGGSGRVQAVQAARERALRGAVSAADARGVHASGDRWAERGLITRRRTQRRTCRRTACARRAFRVARARRRRCGRGTRVGCR